MSYELRRDVMAGAEARPAGGLVFGWAMKAQGVLRALAGLIGLTSAGTGMAVRLAIAVLVGAAFGANFRYQPGGYTGSFSRGLLYGLL